MILAALLAGCPLRTLHYEPTAIDLGRPDPIVVDLLPVLAERTNVLRDWSVAEGRPKVETLSDLPAEVLYAMYAYSRPWTRGAELDLLIDLGEGPKPVTLQWSERREVLVDYSDAPPSRALPPYDPSLPVEPWAAEIAGLRGIGGFVGEGWSVREVGDVATALSALSREELRVLRGVYFVRSPRSSTAPRRELASFDPATEPPTLSFFDLAFDSDALSFVGPADAPVATGAMTALHEFGHALADWPMRLAYTRYTEAFDAWKGGADGGRALWKAPYRDYRALGRKGPVIVAWDELRSGRRGPTTYGDRDPHESFAEAFALYHLDPEALERAMPGAVAWFARGEHIRAAGLTDLPREE